VKTGDRDGTFSENLISSAHTTSMAPSRVITLRAQSRENQKYFLCSRNPFAKPYTPAYAARWYPPNRSDKTTFSTWLRFRSSPIAPQELPDAPPRLQQIVSPASSLCHPRRSRRKTPVSISGYFSKSAHLPYTGNVRVTGEWMTEKEYRARYPDLSEVANSEITERTQSRK
jgi:hypothetical protein